MNFPVPLWLMRAIWWLQKKSDARRKLTDEQGAAIADYYTKAANMFGALGIDVNSKLADVRRLYFMMLLYLDRDEAICPAGARTASLIGFLDSLGSGWVLPPTSAPVSRKFAEEVDGYVAAELLRNHLGLNDIREELLRAIQGFDARKAISQILDRDGAASSADRHGR
jgi:hypothetical protein